MADYSNAQKAIACDIIRKRYNGSITKECVDEIREAIGSENVPRHTIFRWWDKFRKVAASQATIDLGEGKGELAPTKAVSAFLDREIRVTSKQLQEKREELAKKIPLDVKLEEAAHMFLDHAVREEILMWTNSKDALLSAAIAIDKMQIMRKLPPEITEMLPAIMAAYEVHGPKLVVIMNKLLSRLMGEAIDPNGNSEKSGDTVVSIPALPVGDRVD